jgi:hypothetical protein
MKANSRKGRRLVLLSALAALALAAPAAANKYKMTYRLTAEGQAAARAALVQKADFLGAPGWKSKTAKPDQSAAAACNGYRPLQSDLVAIGDAKVIWDNTGTEIESEATVLQTPAMVETDWKRFIRTPGMVSCLRRSLEKEGSKSMKLVSVNRIGFPRVAPHLIVFRNVIDYRVNGKTVRMLSDLILFANGRTESSLIIAGLYSIRSAIRAAEIRIAKNIVARSTA